MVKITNDFGDVKTGRQGEAVFQRHYGQQIRRLVKPKTGEPSKTQLAQRGRFQAALAWRKDLSRAARLYLEGYSIANGIVDSYGIPLTWDRFALKIALEKPQVFIIP